jgi:lipopolysaccharide/colanic/teichoic acid biosynthesis glycosyltransferase
MLPILATIALLVRANLGSPVLFRQIRPGLHGKPFKIFKFRTMTDARDGNGKLLPDALRITPLGRFLRKSSLDEIPALWNVLKGEMSLIGPRPLLIRYLGRYSSEQARRHEVKPGLSGWAQVNGRNAIPWNRKLAMDVWYVDNLSIGLDFKIMAITLKKLMMCESVDFQGDQAMPDFYPHEIHLNSIDSRTEGLHE